MHSQQPRIAMISCDHTKPRDVGIYSAALPAHVTYELLALVVEGKQALACRTSISHCTRMRARYAGLCMLRIMAERMHGRSRKVHGLIAYV